MGVFFPRFSTKEPSLEVGTSQVSLLKLEEKFELLLSPLQTLEGAFITSYLSKI